MPALTIENASLATFDFKSNTGQITIDKALGVVEAFVSAIGNKDSVGDIVMSGAFNASLKRRKPRVVWGHDWNQPIGKVLEIYEVPPSDPRLPTKMRTAGVGGLYAKVQFNLNTERGREAFANVAFYGHDQEWCVDENTEILTDRGWLRYDQLTTDHMAYTLNPELGWGAFEPVLAVNVWPSKTRTLRHIETGGFSSLTTDAHRWPVADNSNGGNVRWTTTGDLKTHDRIIRSAPRFDAPTYQKYDDAFVELVGWFWNEGWIPPADHPDNGLYIAQSTEANPEHVASIRACMQAAFPGQWKEAHSADNMARFRLTKVAADTVLAVTGNGKAPTPDFLMSLTRSQLKLLIDTCLAGDGHQSKAGQRTWYQVSEDGVRAFEMLCALAGQPTNTCSTKNYGNRYGAPPQRVSLLKSGVAKPLDAIRVKSYNSKDRRTVAVDDWVDHTGIVWCPTTASGTWLARRNGSVYFTGNSIGYKTITSAYDPARSANLLKEVELYEVSPVLHGANQLTGTISVKNDDAMSGVTDLRSVLEKLFSNMLKKPVTVRSIDDDSVVIALPDGKLWRAPFSSEDGRMMIGKPVAVREVTSFESIDDMDDEGEPAMMTVKDFEYSDEMMMPVKGGDDEYSEYGGKKPDFLDDPMTLLLMAYNEMLKLNGAAALRSKTLSLISDLEKFMVSKKPSGDDESGFVIRMKCHPSQVKAVERAMTELPVYLERSADGVNIKFSTKLDHDTLLFKTAEALSSLDFEPVFSVSNPSNTLNM